MNVAQFIQQTYLLASGKASGVSATNTAKILSLGNMFQLNWAHEPGIAWESLRIVENVGTVSATDTYDISGINNLSRQEGDYVTIDRTDGKQSVYTIVPAQKLYSMSRGNADGLCARSGTDLIFERAFTATSPELGGTINLPHYPDPDPLVHQTDQIAVDDPLWLCFISAAEYDRNDITKQNQYGNLVAQAINSMDAMKERNQSQREEVDVSNWSPLGQTW